MSRMRMVAMGGVLTLGALATALDPSNDVAAQSPVVGPTFTFAQAEGGKALYAQHCATCHGANLDDGQFAAPLKGVEFQRQWFGQSLDRLFVYVTTNMPPANPGSLGDGQYAQIVAHLLQNNGLQPRLKELPSEPDALKTMIAPLEGGGMEVPDGVVLPPPPARRNPLDTMASVSDSTLLVPPEGDWLMWRGTHDAHGFSQLRQINKNNVSQLRVAWSWALPPGSHQTPPLVHDGVLFALSYGEVLQAIDAATGELLWQYRHRLPKGIPISMAKRSLAIYRDSLYMPTSDARIVALDVKTGKVTWSRPIADAKVGYSISGGPIIAKGKVMTGTRSLTAPGGNFIVALDAMTGKEAWRFNTIAREGEPAANTWNGLPVDKRTGAGAWIPGSYDAETNLVFFGIGQTYDTLPLRDLTEGGKNDALYTDSTVAIDPDTGRLAWFFQHQPNDQWDLDWVFERTVTTLPVDGTPTRVVVTGGKQMIFEALEARTGKYLFSIDLGLQNVVTAIDPGTGAKTIDATKIPRNGKGVDLVCPHVSGGRDWMPTSYNAASRILFVPLTESCMTMFPVAPGARGTLTTGVRWTTRPRPDSDGNYGRVQAINLDTRKPVWAHRQRAPQSTGTLATAGGLVFAGALDRFFSAYDDATGKELWHARLNNVPNAAPITYAVNGKQYIAVIASTPGAAPATFRVLVPEIRNPESGASLWVFELPESAQR